MRSSLTVSLTLCATLVAAQTPPNTLDTLDRLLQFQFAGKNIATCNDDPEVAKYFKYIAGLRSSWMDQQKMSGKATVAANSDFQPRNDLFKLNAAVELSRGIFPSQFRVKAAVGITLGNGVFQENISELNIAYDYHPRYTKQEGVLTEDVCKDPNTLGQTSDRKAFREIFEKIKDPLRWENYVYMTRFSDNFMKLDQRYEVGLGTIVAHWSAKATANGAEPFTRFQHLRKAHCTGVPECLKKVKDSTGNKAFSDDGHAEVSRANHRAWGSSRKNTTVWRYGLLGGLMGEVEKHAVATDSLWNDSMLVKYEIPGQSVMRLRYVLRPFIDYRPTDRFSISYRPYFVMPAPWEWMSSVAYLNEQGEEMLDERIDWRLDSQFKVEIKLTPASDASNKEVTVGISYRSWYDNAPNRRAVDSFLDGVQQLVVAPGVHNQVLFSLGVAL